MDSGNQLIQKARQKAPTDAFAAKAWLLTAKAVCPNNFDVQFEGYNVEKLSGNVQEAARCLTSLVGKYRREAKLETELIKTVDAAYGDYGGFYSSMFHALAADVQFKLVTTVAEMKESVLDQCKLMLYAIRHYPKLSSALAISLVNRLVTHVTRSRSHSIKAMLVCQVLPVVLDIEHVTLPQNLAQQLLDMAVGFYLHSLNNGGDVGDGGVDDVGGVGVYSGGVDETWSQIRNVLRVIHHEPKDLLTHSDQVTRRGATELLELSQEYESWRSVPGVSMASDGRYLQIFYRLLVLLLRSIYEYVSIVRPNSIRTATHSHAYESDQTLVLVEIMTSSPPLTEGNMGEEHQAPPEKKSKGSNKKKSAVVDVSVSETCLYSQSVIDSLQVAVDTWQYIHRHKHLLQEFTRVCTELRLSKLSWYQSFIIDLSIYLKDYHSYAETLPHVQPAVADGQQAESSDTLRQTRLQMALLCYHTQRYQEMGKQLISLLQSIHNPAATLSASCHKGSSAPPPQSSSFTKLALEKQQQRDASGEDDCYNLHLLALTDIDILHYSVHLLIHRLKVCGGVVEVEGGASAAGVDLSSDQQQQQRHTVLGHLIVLCQLHWPLYLPLFESIVNVIHTNSVFTYNLFFHFVIVIDILEEFCYLKTAQGGRVDLDVMPITTAVMNKQRTMTRGADREVREDFKVSMEKQVSSRSGEDVNLLLWTFCITHSDSVLRALQ